MEKSIYTKEYACFLRLLRQSREEREVTQVRLAESLETTQVFVSKVERGDRRLDVIELRRWCHALDIKLDEFARLLDASCVLAEGGRARQKSRRAP